MTDRLCLPPTRRLCLFHRAIAIADDDDLNNKQKQQQHREMNHGQWRKRVGSSSNTSTQHPKTTPITHSSSMEPPSLPLTIISSIGGQINNNGNGTMRRSHPSSSAELEQQQQQQAYIQQQQQQPLQHDDDDEHHVEDIHHQSRLPQHFPSQHETIDNINNEDEQLRQKIAQKMLTTTTTTSSPASFSTRNFDEIWEEEDINFSMPERYFPAPWEQTANVDYNHHIHLGAPPPPPPPQTQPPYHHIKVEAPPPPLSPPPPPYLSKKQDPIATNDENTMQSTAAAAPTTTTTIAATNTTTPKSVTFRTHDEVHQFDEQLETFKHVDEEFFHVAHYLLEVVDYEYVVNDPGIFDNEEEEYTSRRYSHRRGGGPGLLSRLCGCGLGVVGEDDIVMQDSIDEKIDIKDSIKHQSKKWRYQLSTKLVSNFVSALTFRMGNIQSKLDDGEEEANSDLVARTREIVRKINTYGLPMMVPPSSSYDGAAMMVEASKLFRTHDSVNVVVSSASLIICRLFSSVTFGFPCSLTSLQFYLAFHYFIWKSSGRERHHRHFPILPLHNDDVDEYEVDENDQNLDNQKQAAHHQSSHYTRAPPPLLRKNLSSLPLNQKQTLPPTIPTSPPRLFSSHLKPQSTTITTTPSSSPLLPLPSEETCRKRLAQISHEIHKASSMIHTTQNSSVQYACSARITKLQNERRYYQIIQERYKIHSMMQSTRVSSVRMACQERLNQLVIELEDLHNIMEEEEEYYGSEGGEEVPEDARREVVEDSRWYDRVLMYVHGPTNENQNNEMSLFARGQPYQHRSPRSTMRQRQDAGQRFSYERHPAAVAHAATSTPCGSLGSIF